MKDDLRTARAKVLQDYEPDPPRCVTCIYHRCEPQQRHVQREVTTRRGKVKVRQFKLKVHPLKNPLVDRCTFGNFIVKRTGVCNEWRNRNGETIQQEETL